MRTCLLKIVSAAVISFLFCSPSFGESPPEIFNKFKPGDIAAILRDAGYRAEFVTENQRPQVRTGMAGYNVVVYFSGCEDDGSCGSLQYSLGIAKSAEFTLTMVNSWNQKKRFAKAYLDAEGNLLLQADVYFDDVTKETVDASARLFDQLAGEFRSMVSSLGTAR
jgi:Putative bacterial sensory transduction regulator